MGCLLVIIDEAQGMTQREWLWLVELHSQLERQRVRLCVISVASLQFFDEAITMALSGGAHVAARFMLATKPFHGIRSVDELSYVMAGYDVGSEWPVGSGQSVRFWIYQDVSGAFVARLCDGQLQVFGETASHAIVALRIAFTRLRTIRE